MTFYLLYDHFDHLLDEVEFARRAYGTVYAYVKLLEQRTEQDGRVTIATAIAVTWMRPVERIIHAARMPVDMISVEVDDAKQRTRSHVCTNDHGRPAHWSMRSWRCATSSLITIFC